MINHNNRTNQLSPNVNQQSSKMTSTINRYEPLREMNEMHRRMDDLFSRVFGFAIPEPIIQKDNSWFEELIAQEPDVDIYENDIEFIVHAALPGINEEDIQIQATENTIYITAESRSPFENQSKNIKSEQNNSNSNGTQQDNRKAENIQQTKIPHTQHRQSKYSQQSRFQFSYTLPEEVKPNEIQANFRNGRLEIQMPKRQTPAQNKPVQIAIGSRLKENGSTSNQEKMGDHQTANKK